MKLRRGNQFPIVETQSAPPWFIILTIDSKSQSNNGLGEFRLYLTMIKTLSFTHLLKHFHAVICGKFVALWLLLCPRVYGNGLFFFCRRFPISNR
jgi:hypothetical protein